MSGPRLDPIMPGPALTDEQRQAVEASEPTVFVSAGAGSGKTAVLVERYVRAAVRDRVPLSDIPTVTFTRKAAGEMRQRIRTRLTDVGEEALAWDIDGAPIGTIHSLCARVLRAHALEAGVDPRFGVLDEDRASILLDEAFEEAWDRRLAVAGDDDLPLLARHWTEIRRDVVRVHQALRQQGMPSPRLDLPRASDPGAAMAALRAVVADVLGQAEGFPAGSQAAKNATALAGRLEVVHAASVTGSWPELEAIANLRPHMGVGNLRPLFEELMHAIEHALRRLGEGYLSRLADLVNGLLADVTDCYEAGKRERGFLDFIDLELRTRALLVGGIEAFGPRSLLLVDEFQDTNELQCAILDGLGTAGAFTVGDQQQSIYGFRGADVQVFKSRRSGVREAPQGVGLEVVLSTNFRSSPALLAVIDHLFGSPALFGEAFAGLKAPACPATSSAPSPAAAELIVVDTAGPVEESSSTRPTRSESEALVVAGRVRDLLAGGRSPREVAVLLRSFTNIVQYEQALRDAGVPVYVVGGRGFYEREELADLLALLRVLVNPHDDLSLALVMRSPLGRFSDDFLYATRQAARHAGRRFLWEALLAGVPPDASLDDARRLPEFMDRVSALRRRVGTPGLATLVEEAVTAFDYDLVLLGIPGGERRFANVRKLMLLADDFESLEGPDLGSFVRYLDSRRDLDGSRDGNAPVAAEDDDVVRVMTVHQAKGLEFPAVFVCGLGSLPRGDPDRVLLGRGGRAAISVPAPDRMDSLMLELGPGSAILSERRAGERDETVRLYYVAATRAREQLFLVGAPPPSGRSQDVPLSWLLGALDLTAADVLERSGERAWRPVPAVDLVVYAAGPEAAGPTAGGVAAGSGDRAPSPAGPVVVPVPAPIPATGTTGLMRVSFSALSEYASCPRGFYLRRVLGVRPELLDTGSEERDLVVDSAIEGAGPKGRPTGVVVHAALEALDLVREPTPIELEAAVQKAVTSAAPAEVDRDRAVRLVRAFWSSPVPRLPGLMKARKEEWFAFDRGDTVVTGVMDLVGSEGDAWWVVDYKTNDLRGRPPAEAIGPYRLQADIYALVLLLGGAATVEARFLFLECPTDPVVIRYGREDIGGLEATLDLALRGLRTGKFPPAESCGPCVLAGACRSFSDG